MTTLLLTKEPDARVAPWGMFDEFAPLYIGALLGVPAACAVAIFGLAQVRRWRAVALVAGVGVVGELAVWGLVFLGGGMATTAVLGSVLVGFGLLAGAATALVVRPIVRGHRLLSGRLHDGLPVLLVAFVLSRLLPGAVLSAMRLPTLNLWWL